MASLVIGTRGSRLAMWQAEYVRDRLVRAHPELAVTLEIIRTTGDRVRTRPLHQIGGKGLFTKELEDALLSRRVDLAVHSLKDLPTELPPGLALGAVPAREDPADALVAKDGRGLADLPAGATVLTGSLRREAQVRHRRPDVDVQDVRGNVETRLRRMRESDAAAIVLARAGLVRLGLGGRVRSRGDVHGPRIRNLSRRRDLRGRPAMRAGARVRHRLRSQSRVPLLRVVPVRRGLHRGRRHVHRRGAPGKPVLRVGGIVLSLPTLLPALTRLTGSRGPICWAPWTTPISWWTSRRFR